MLVISLLILVTSCVSNDGYKPTLSPNKVLVDIRDAEKSVTLLCTLLEQLTNEELTNEEYKNLQIQVEAIYLGLEFGINAGFYSNEDLLRIADTLNCLI